MTEVFDVKPLPDPIAIAGAASVGFTAFAMGLPSGADATPQVADPAPDTPLDRLADSQWRDRLLVVCLANGAARTLADAQLAAAMEDPEGYRERQLIIAIISSASITTHRPLAPGERAGFRTGTDPRDSGNLRRRTHCSGQRSGIRLIGLDGGVKAAWPGPVTNETLFATIDAMPMRANEIERRDD